MKEYMTMLLLLLFLEQQKTIVKEETILKGLAQFPQLEIKEGDVSIAISNLIKRGLILVHLHSFYDISHSGNNYSNNNNLIRFIRYNSSAMLKKDLRDLVQRYTI